jgi:hypothetical protein
MLDWASRRWVAVIVQRPRNCPLIEHGAGPGLEPGSHDVPRGSSRDRIGVAPSEWSGFPST